MTRAVAPWRASTPRSAASRTESAPWMHLFASRSRWSPPRPRATLVRALISKRRSMICSTPRTAFATAGTGRRCTTPASPRAGWPRSSTYGRASWRGSRAAGPRASSSDCAGAWVRRVSARCAWSRSIARWETRWGRTPPRSTPWPRGFGGVCQGIARRSSAPPIIPWSSGWSPTCGARCPTTRPSAGAERRLSRRSKRGSPSAARQRSRPSTRPSPSRATKSCTKPASGPRSGATGKRRSPKPGA